MSPSAIPSVAANRRDRDVTYRAVDEALAVGWQPIVLTVDVVRGAYARPLMPADPTASNDHVPFASDLTFEDIGRFRERFGLPVVVKGILRSDDAVAAVDAGAAALVVSNHGGRQLDAAEATASALPAVTAAVAGRAEVFVDGGIRAGVDIVRALAMGAQGALIGRPTLYALVVAGSEGVASALRGLRAEVETAMALCGAREVAEIDAELIAS